MKVKSLMVIGCLMACVFCPSVFGQEETSQAELFGGFSLVQRSDGKLPGWGVSVAADIASGFAFKLDMSGGYSTLRDFDDSSVSQHNILGGAQYAKRFEHVNVFAEALAGLGHVRERIGGEYGNANGFAMAFGGGLDWKFSQKLGWRVAQLDYMPLRVNGATEKGFRLQTGLLIPFGK